MTARFLVVDSGGVTREMSRFPVVDSGGVTREIQRAFVIDSGGTARLFFSGAQVSLSDETLTANATTPSNASISYQLAATGDIERIRNGTTVDIGDWILPHTGMTDYECRATVTSGSLTSGTTGTWLALGSVDRTWTKTRTNDTPGTDTVVFTIEIRRASDSVVVATATITLSATVGA